MPNLLPLHTQGDANLLIRSLRQVVIHLAFYARLAPLQGVFALNGSR